MDVVVDNIFHQLRNREITGKKLKFSGYHRCKRCGQQLTCEFAHFPRLCNCPWLAEIKDDNGKDFYCCWNCFGYVSSIRSIGANE
jgi:hypothetical protein